MQRRFDADVSSQLPPVQRDQQLPHYQPIELVDLVLDSPDLVQAPGLLEVERLHDVVEALRDQDLEPLDQRVDRELRGVYEALRDDVPRVRLDDLQPPEPLDGLDHHVSPHLVQRLLAVDFYGVIAQGVRPDDQPRQRLVVLDQVGLYRGLAGLAGVRSRYQPQRAVSVLPEQDAVAFGEVHLLRELLGYRDGQGRVSDLLHLPQFVHG